MGSILKLDAGVNIQAFPGAKFEIVGDVPAPQCSEAKIEGDTAQTRDAPDFDLLDPNKFTGYDLAGKKCTIVTSVGGNTGLFSIFSNTDHELEFLEDPGDGAPVTYYVHDGGELILTRNVPSFAEFIHAAGYAYTIKGGKLYTDMPSGQLKNACTILFDPIA